MYEMILEANMANVSNVNRTFRFVLRFITQSLPFRNENIYVMLLTECWIQSNEMDLVVD